jgi:hypothetical protein
VPAAKAWLATRRVARAHIEWRENIRVWHPGQDWILAAGGLGVFDPGINALSIVTAILPMPLRVASASLDFPKGRGAPIAATLAMASGDANVWADFDFLQTGLQSWTITVETDAETLMLLDGGARLFIDDVEQKLPESGEYPCLYRHFAALIAAPVAAIGIVADLVESVIKRRANMKDSGRSIPGIGGMFDLSDSLLLAAPVGYFFFALP